MAKTPTTTQSATRADLKELRTQINEDVRTHMGTLYEKFHGDVKLLAEQHQETDKRVKKLEGKIDLLIETVGEMKTDVTDIKDQLKQKVNVKDHQTLEHRVTLLESKA